MTYDAYHNLDLYAASAYDAGVAAERERIAELADKAFVRYLAPGVGWQPFSNLIRAASEAHRD